LVPIAIKILIFLYVREPISVEALIGQGELLVLTVGLAARALKDLIAMRGRKRLFRTSVLFFSFVATVGCSALFALDRNAAMLSLPRNVQVVVVVSLVLYPLAVVVSGACAARTER
jgi:uncharacterized membrane protein YhhN